MNYKEFEMGLTPAWEALPEEKRALYEDVWEALSWYTSWVEAQVLKLKSQQDLAEMLFSSYEFDTSYEEEMVGYFNLSSPDEFEKFKEQFIQFILTNNFRSYENN